MSVSLLVASTSVRRWPLVGDAALMHYVIFLLRGGAIPYRQIVDINLPGTYFFEAAGMVLFGREAWGLHLYDWFLLVCIAVACVGLTGRRRWFAGVFSGLFFALVHFQDGLEQQGERDLLLAALLLGGLGAFRLILEGTKHKYIAALAFGLAFGVSFTVKPVLLPLAVLVLGFGLFKTTTLRSPFVFGLTLFGLLSPGFVAIFWLVQEGVLRDFIGVAHSLLPLHAALGRKPISFLFNHSFSPLGFLLLCGLVLLFLGQARFLDHKLLLVGSLAGTLLAYIVQGKGFPYQRYPLLVVLLLILGLLMDHALEAPGRSRWIALTMAFWAAFAGMYFAWRSTRFQTQTPTVAALSRQLAGFGSPNQLNGEVQCLDTFGGCVNTLYDLGIRQSTGFLYDCYLFTGATAERTAYCEHFWADFQKTKPRLVVLSSHNCFKNVTNGYGRLASWPALEADLQEHYREVATWAPTTSVSWFSRKQMPSGFKILIRDRR